MVDGSLDRGDARDWPIKKSRLGPGQGVKIAGGTKYSILVLLYKSRRMPDKTLQNQCRGAVIAGRVCELWE
jgi:hypothetical protein